MTTTSYDNDLLMFTYPQIDVMDGEALKGFAVRGCNLDVLLNNAGLAIYRTAEFDLGTFRKVVETNLTSVMAWSEAFLVDLTRNRSSSRVPTGSTAVGTRFADPDVFIETRLAPQGMLAEFLATVRGIGCSELDEYVVASHKRASQACGEGFFGRSTVAVHDQNGFLLLDFEEHIRPEATHQSLAALVMSFASTGTLGFDTIVLQRYSSYN